MGISLAQGDQQSADFHIQKCSSEVDYPDKGDESLNVEYAGSTYRVRIAHPKIAPVETHVSCPFFWVEGKVGLDSFEQIVTVRTFIHPLSWHSACWAYFFAEKHGQLRGFFLENGCDNADNGSSGLLFLQDGKTVSAWHWMYHRDPEKPKGHYEINAAEEAGKVMPKELMKRILPMLERAEKDADAWPGP